MYSCMEDGPTRDDVTESCGDQPGWTDDQWLGDDGLCRVVHAKHCTLYEIVDNLPTTHCSGMEGTTILRNLMKKHT